MKDSASAASARAEFVLRFPWAVPVRRPQLPTPETLPDRWLQAAEEEEEELLPFRSPPREENGTAPTPSPAGEMALRVVGSEGVGFHRPGCRPSRAAAGVNGPPALPRDFLIVLAARGVRFIPGRRAGRR